MHVQPCTASACPGSRVPRDAHCSRSPALYPVWTLKSCNGTPHEGHAEDHTMERKLAAILSTDVKGYSRLMGEDEAATIRTLSAYRTLMATLIQQYRGRVVDSPGDNLLAEFPSVVEAVQCAVAIQRELRVRNAELPPNRRMEFRIGINLGDVITDGERLYGD